MAGVSDVTSVAASSSGDKFSALSSEDFLEVILTELGQQDPLQPNDTGALLEQLSMIRSIESDLNLGDQLTDLARHEGITAGASLIGRNVGGVGETLGRTTGTVVGAGRVDNDIVLTLTSGERMKLSNVDTVEDADEMADNSPVEEVAS